MIWSLGVLDTPHALQLGDQNIVHDSPVLSHDNERWDGSCWAQERFSDSFLQDEDDLSGHQRHELDAVPPELESADIGLSDLC